jgi:MFS family permease
MNLAMSLYRSPTVSLMPDITEEKRRTRANGIINFMGGIGSILAFGVGSVLYSAHHSLPFIAAAGITLVSLFILRTFIQEKRDAPGYQAQTAAKSKVSFKSQINRTTVLLLAAIFFWFVAYQGVETLFTLYGKNEMGLTESQASFSLTFFSLAFVLFAIPSGWFGGKFGKKRMILIGVSGLFIVFALVPWVESLLWLRVLLTVGGLFWACININSYPFIVSTGSEDSIGTRTGMYYLVSSLAAISSPPLLGKLIDGMGYSILFYCAAGSMLLALICVLMIRHQETENPAQSQTASAGLS